MAYAAGLRVTVHLERILVLGITRKICDSLGIDALGLTSSGALLVAIGPAPAARLVNALRKAHISESPIGGFEAGRGVRAKSASKVTRLPWFERDEILRVRDSQPSVCEGDFFEGSSPRLLCSHSLCTIRDGPAVRSDSLVERGGFEPPVLFVVPGACERLGFQRGRRTKTDQRNCSPSDLAAKFWPKTTRTSTLFQGKKPKRDRRFESPLLHQRGTANRRAFGRSISRTFFIPNSRASLVGKLCLNWDFRSTFQFQLALL
jgi:hypothetical protein